MNGVLASGQKGACMTCWGRFWTKGIRCCRVRRGGGRRPSLARGEGVGGEEEEEEAWEGDGARVRIRGVGRMRLSEPTRGAGGLRER